MTKSETTHSHSVKSIPFHQPFFTGNEQRYLQEALSQNHIQAGGVFTKRCEAWLQNRLGCQRAMLVSSGTAALEMIALLIDLQAGDEILMPSFTFTSTANAFVLRGAVPVFVDIRPDTYNINEALLEKAITPKTKAIVMMHYGGISCEIEAIVKIAEKHRLFVIEDAAHALGATWRNRPLGSFGHLSAFSFHDTKGVHCGEGGALVINDVRFLERAEWIRDKGTNRAQFLDGKIDHYSWVDLGSSYLMSDLSAAFLWAQLEAFDSTLARQLFIWKTYQNALTPGMFVSQESQPNGTLYALKLSSPQARTAFMEHLKHHGIECAFHYVPLHLSQAGKKYARCGTPLSVTENVGAQLVRLPLWLGIEEALPYIIENVQHVLHEIKVKNHV